MSYEPVDYIYEYVICAALFFVIIMVRYFTAHRFPNQKNNLFSVILWVTIVDLISDVLSALIIDNVLLVPLPITYTINTIFYALQIILPLLMTTFTLVMANYIDRSMVRRYIPLLLPGLALLLTLLTNPITRWFFYVDPVSGYERGPLFIFIYVVCLFYLIVSMTLAILNRKAMQKDEFANVCRFLIIVLTATIIQFLYPRLLITGVAIAIAVTLMYFTIQNPNSMLDTATGAFTYEAMLAFLHDQAQAKHNVQLVSIKIRNMPRINEILGIGNGSLLLKQISFFLMNSAKGTWVFRMRGSCFVAITLKNNDYKCLCQQVQEHISDVWTINATEILLQATVCYIATEDLISPQETVNYLESVFLQNTHFTENIKQVHVGADLLIEMQRRKAVEAALREALESEIGLEIYLQPLWNTKHLSYDSAEALLRFRHATLGVIPPDEFVPIAESCGLITAMDEFVIRKVCAFINENNHLRELPLQSIEINLSALEFMHHRLPELIDEITQQYGVDPKLLCFEITETSATESFEILKDCMLDICAKGCHFALDDFGIGYANISQVIQLPFSMVKLDRSLLYGPQEVLEDMTHMFNRMGRLTVIEGIESPEQAEFAYSIGVGYIQGFYYSKPLAQQDFIDFLLGVKMNLRK